MRHGLVSFLLALSLFGVVLGLKLDVVHRFGSDLPMWDQWDAEGLTVFVPWSKGQLTLEHLFRPHNEHRVALTRLLGMAELAANGQWDARLQCVVNAVLHAGLAVALFSFARQLLGIAWSGPSFVLLAALIGLPLAWQNVVSGFHSQQYFLLLLSLGVIALMPTSAPWSVRWWLGFVSGLLALFSMASGLLAAIATAAVVLLAVWRGTRSLPEQWPTLLACGLLTGIGAALLVHYDGHDGLRARNVSEFVRYSLHSLQWPAETPAAALLLWAPVAALGTLLIRRRATDDAPAALALFGLGGWTLAQIFASAYARGVDGGHPASRYMDTLAFGLTVNALAALWLLRRSTDAARFAVLAGVLAWTGTAGYGVYRIAYASYTSALPETRAYYARCETNVRAYLATDDPSHLRGEDFPYPNANNFRQRVDEPALRKILPASVRPPLRLQTARGGGVMRAVPGNADAGFPSRHWTSRGGPTGTWQSVGVDFPHVTTLLFRFDGTFADTDAPQLQWRELRLGMPVADVIAARAAGSPHFTATVRVPAGAAQLVARIEKPEHWLAFEEPVEVARFSDLAARFAAHGWWLTLASAVAAVALLAAERVREWR